MPRRRGPFTFWAVPARFGKDYLLGVRTLEGFRVMVDHTGRRFVATTTLVANLT